MLVAEMPCGIPWKTAAVIQLLAEFHRDGRTVLLVAPDKLGHDRVDRVLGPEAGRLCTTSQAP